MKSFAFHLRFLLLGICEFPLGLSGCSALSVEAARFATTVTLAISVTGLGSDCGRFCSFEHSERRLWVGNMRCFLVWITVTLSSIHSSSNSYWGRTRIEPALEEEVVATEAWTPLGTPVKGGGPSLNLAVEEGTTLEVKNDETVIRQITFFD